MERNTRRERLRRKLGGGSVHAFFAGLSKLASLHPHAAPGRHNLEVFGDLSYGPLPAHRLEIWRPIRAAAQPLPVILHVHGGGFRILSKESHWIMALALARRGYLVVNIDYRLAPLHAYPAAIEDVCRAWCWVQAQIARFGGDPERVAVAGESAGANLVTALTLAACWEREEDFAREVFLTGQVPTALFAACGIHQVSDVERLWREAPLHAFFKDRFEEISRDYLGKRAHAHRPGRDDLADPLLFLERAACGEERAPERALPPCFAPVGGADILREDGARLERALKALGSACEARVYEGEVHAFHAFVWRAQARQCWRDVDAFFDAHHPPA